MRILLDTHVLLWAAGEPKRLSRKARALFDATENLLMFSAASLWEVVIKSQLGRQDFRVDARALRRGLLDHGYEELSIASEHVVAVEQLPPLHRDPFDRLLIAQAIAEGITLVTSDENMAKYSAPIRLV
jgi:PIN domain nuclease of toxin-antitoxin system